MHGQQNVKKNIKILYSSTIVVLAAAARGGEGADGSAHRGASITHGNRRYDCRRTDRADG